MNLNKPNMNERDEIINKILKEAYKAVPSRVSLDGNKLIEIHDKIGDILQDYSQQYADLQLSKERELPSNDKIELVASDESQIGWNDLRFKPIYEEGFIEGVKWMRKQLTHPQEKR